MYCANSLDIYQDLHPLYVDYRKRIQRELIDNCDNSWMNRSSEQFIHNIIEDMMKSKQMENNVYMYIKYIIWD
eukprot:UN12541